MRSAWARLLAAAATSALVLWFARDELGGVWWWVAPGVALVALALGFAIPVAQRALPPGWVPGLLLGVTALNYACVPETDHIPPIAVLPALLVLIELASGRRLPWGVHLFVAGFVLWAGVYGATGRESALVGALFSWWPVVVLPCFARRLPTLRSPRLGAPALVIASLAAAPAVLSRSGALEPTIGRALVEVVVLAPLSLAVAWALTVVLRERPTKDDQRAG